ncbi:STAS domain-containing protein [Embleya sp. NPDC005971]|uniref:STAS domain-containing protein n=1 Tax=Embleya sp. NPDC005971 TaxID=3156724 RepID=UPI0034060DA8
MPKDPTLATQTLLSVDTFLAGGSALLILGGDIDVDTAPVLRRAVDHCLDRHCSSVHVDLYAIDFCDCAGLGTFVWARRRAGRSNTAILFHHAPPLVRALAAATGAVDVLLP